MDFIGIGNLPLFSTPAVFLVLVVAFILIRTKSPFFLYYKMWRLLNRKDAINSTKIRKNIEEKLDLNAFKFFFGIHLPSIRRYEDLMAWLKKNSIDLDLIAKCGRLFDATTLSLRVGVPKNQIRNNFYFGAILIIFLPLAAINALLTSFDAALLQFKESSASFLQEGFSLTTDSAHMWRHKDIITIDSCSKNELVKTDSGFSEKQVAELCKFLENKEKADKFVTTTVKQQRWLFGFLALLFTLFLIHSYSNFRRASAAIRVRDHLASEVSLQLPAVNANIP